MTQGRDVGVVNELIVRAILSGARNVAQLQPATKQFVSGVSLERVLKRMETRGWLQRTKTGYQVTTSGLRCLPSKVAIQEAANFVPYRPPRTAPRRPGSMDFAEIPSVASGCRIEWRHPT